MIHRYSCGLKIFFSPIYPEHELDQWAAIDHNSSILKKKKKKMQETTKQTPTKETKIAVLSMIM